MNRFARLSVIGFPSLALFGLGVASFADEDPGRTSIAVCRHSAADGGPSRKADLGAPEREVASARKKLRAGLASLEQKSTQPKAEGYDAGLPGCTRSGEEEKILTQPLPSVFRDRTLYFLSLAKSGKPPRGIPASFEKDALVFVLSYSSLKDVGEFARTTGARVSIGTMELARKFGARCAPSRVDVSSDGMTLRIKEILP
jgi:hypothetical protein